jgi:hypothetical protein
MSRHRVKLGFVLIACLATVSGCASAVKQATKEAAPTAVQASVKEVHNPKTRERVADVLADPEIRTSTAALSQAVADGFLNAVTEKERVDKAMVASDAFLEHMNRSLARSLEHDLSPALAALVAATMDRTFEKIAAERPAVNDAIGAAAREAGRQAALGFQDAVIQSDARQRRGEARPGEVLASVGRASDAVLHTTSILVVAVAAALVLAVLGGFAWLFMRLRHERTLNQSLRRQQTV